MIVLKNQPRFHLALRFVKHHSNGPLRLFLYRFEMVRFVSSECLPPVAFIDSIIYGQNHFPTSIVCTVHTESGSHSGWSRWFKPKTLGPADCGGMFVKSSSSFSLTSSLFCG